MTVPDTLYGAFLLSILDFFLSLAFIWLIGLGLRLLRHVNRLGEIDENDLTGGH